MKPARVITYALLLLGAAVMIFPLWWMTVISLLDAPAAAAAAVGGTADAEGANAARDVRLWVDTPHFINYADALRRFGTTPAPAPPTPEPPPDWGGWIGWWLTRLQPSRGFLDALANSIVVTTLSVLGQVLACSLVGYAFARLRFRGREPLFVLMLSTMMLPAQVTMIPMFILFRWLGWIDTILPLVVPLFFGTPFFIFMFRQFLAQIPEALVEAARLDGAGHLAIWSRLMLPLCKPVIAITAIFTFIGTWNDFLNPLIYLHSDDQATLAVALNSFRNQYGGVGDVHLLMAASLITMIPCIVLFFVAQRQFVAGLQLGGVKG